MKKKTFWQKAGAQLEELIEYFKNDRLMTLIVVVGLVIIVVIITGIAGLPQYKTERVEEELSDDAVDKIIVAIDDNGNPIFEKRSKRSSVLKSKNNEEIKYTTMLQYRDDAKSGYMNNCIFLGDSRTVAMVDYGFVNDDNVLAKIGISHTQVKGTTFVQNSGREYTLSSYLGSHQYPVIYINYGVNGLPQGKLDKYNRQYSELLEEIIALAPNSNIVLMGVWPVVDKSHLSNAKIDEFNQFLLELAGEKGLYYLDIESVLKGDNGQMKSDFNAGDGLHYSPYAYNTIIDYIIHHPVPGVKDDGEFKVKYIPPSSNKASGGGTVGNKKDESSEDSHEEEPTEEPAGKDIGITPVPTSTPMPTPTPIPMPTANVTPEENISPEENGEQGGTGTSDTGQGSSEEGGDSAETEEPVVDETEEKEPEEIPPQESGGEETAPTLEGDEAIQPNTGE